MSLPGPFSSACLMVLAAVAFPAAAQKNESGVLWEQTTEMKMPGFAMPPQMTKVCLPKKDWTQPPKAEKDDHCKVTDVKHSGNRMTWHVVCEGKEKMTGDGEMARSGDTYTGKMTMNTSHGQVVMNMSGRKVGGDCDAGAQQREMEAQKKQAEQMQAQGKAAMDQVCDGMVGRMNARMLEAMRCNDRLKDVCARLPTPAGYSALTKNNPPQDQQYTAQKCNSDLDAVRAKLCASEARKVDLDAAAGQKSAAGNQGSANEVAIEFVGKNCPVESRQIAQRECAGQSFCDMEPAKRDFCVKYAKDVLDENKTRKKATAKKPPEVPAQPARPAADQARRAAKKLLPF